MRQVIVSPTIAATAYTADDAVGGLLTFPNALLAPHFAGEIVGITVIDRAAQDAALVLQLFDQTFTPTADLDPYNPSDADLANAVANVVIPAANYAGGAGNSLAFVPLAIPVDGISGSLFGQLFTSGTPTYGVATALTLKLLMRA